MSKEYDPLNPDTMDLIGGKAESAGNYDENMTLNLSDTSDELPKFEAMPPGVYPAIVENVEFGPSSNGNPMLTWTFTITHPDYENRKQFLHTVLNNDFGVRMLKRVLVRVCPDVDIENFSPREFADNGYAVGLPCRLKLNVRSYSGEKRNNVKDVLPAEGPEDYFDDK